MALLDWSEPAKQAFLQQQFTAQHTYYQQHYATASFQVVLRDDAMVGRLYVDRGPDEIRIIDIALLSEYRGAGLGTRLVTALLTEAAQTGRVITIHVERFNPALRWYQRLGFKQIEDQDVYLLLQWSADDHVKMAS
jgi:ribosomal protein S18 acetylase RimI-like enzyme